MSLLKFNKTIPVIAPPKTSKQHRAYLEECRKVVLRQIKAKWMMFIINIPLRHALHKSYQKVKQLECEIFKALHSLD